jgi:hypothetical protein
LSETKDLIKRLTGRGFEETKQFLNELDIKIEYSDVSIEFSELCILDNLFFITGSHKLKKPGRQFNTERIFLKDDLGNHYSICNLFPAGEQNTLTLPCLPPVDPEAKKLLLNISGVEQMPGSFNTATTDRGEPAKAISNGMHPDIHYQYHSQQFEIDLRSMKREQYSVSREEVKIGLIRKDKEIFINEIWIYPHCFCLVFYDDRDFYSQNRTAEILVCLFSGNDCFYTPQILRQTDPFGNNTVLCYYFRDGREINPDIVRDYLKDIRIMTRDEAYQEMKKGRIWKI